MNLVDTVSEGAL